MIGAVAGDMVGAPYEGRHPPPPGFPLFRHDSCFTDDTVCSLAIATAVVEGGDYATVLRDFVRRHPEAGYGPSFKRWATEDGAGSYGSNGNGPAMRVAAIGWAAADQEDALRQSVASAIVSHDHPDAVSGAQAIALAIFLARQGNGGPTIRRKLVQHLGYAVPATPTPFIGFDGTAAGTVPQALACALDSGSWESAVRRAVALGGDTDTVASMAGAVAEALHGVPDDAAGTARARLTPDLEHAFDRFQHWSLKRFGPLHGLWARLTGR